MNIQVNWKFKQKRLISSKTIKSLSQRQILKRKKENQVASEENEQHGRRLSPRIDGIHTPWLREVT